MSKISLAIAHAVASVYAALRDFFARRGVLEVHTPLVMPATVTDPYLSSFSVRSADGSQLGYLQTSPEYAMKRLLVEGYGDIYQICKAFRAGDIGRYHQPEFTLLEWYRIGFDHHTLMDEMDALLIHVLDVKPADRFSYRDVFLVNTGIDPWKTSSFELASYADTHGIPHPKGMETIDETTWLQLIMSEHIEPKLGLERPCFIYNYPVAQAALAKINKVDGVLVAERFEVYCQGIELANGFHELQNPDEQKIRFTQDLEKRSAENLPIIEMDRDFIAALNKGLPACAGVALGVDRLIMLAMQNARLSDILHFPIADV